MAENDEVVKLAISCSSGAEASRREIFGEINVIAISIRI